MRSVVLKRSVRCPQCQLPPRWCVCSVHSPLTCSLEIDVLMHHREQFRPSSTGHLIHRIIPASRHHLWRRERRVAAADLHIPGRELWIMHPQGEPVPTDRHASEVQIVLLDGSWREASAIAQEIGHWGRLVNLPMHATSRYWLRTQADAARSSTAEALLFLLRHFGLEHAHDALQLQFELHVYANLRARGHKEDALEFLQTSPIATTFADFIARLDIRRPR
jgi:DTW domain-containing protein